jgi:hypothetical protein
MAERPALAASWLLPSAARGAEAGIMPTMRFDERRDMAMASPFVGPGA